MPRWAKCSVRGLHLAGPSESAGTGRKASSRSAVERKGSSDSAPRGRGGVGLRTNICSAHACCCLPFSNSWPRPVSCFSVHSLYRALAVMLREGHRYPNPSPWCLIWKESPVPTHYRPRASSEPMSHAWGTAPSESRHLGHCRDPGHLRAEERQQCSLAGPQLPSNVPGVCWAPGTTMHVGLEEAQSWAPGSRALGLKWTTVS